MPIQMLPLHDLADPRNQVGRGRVGDAAWADPSRAAVGSHVLPNLMKVNGLIPIDGPIPPVGNAMS